MASTTPVCVIDSSGIHKPLFSTCLAYYQAQYGSIYGIDLVNDAADRDTQFLAARAAALDDVNSATVAAYNAFRPEYAQGVGLSSVVKINGISRLVPSYSTAIGLVVGVVGTTITNGIVKDDQGYQWALPASVVIPSTGQISVTVTCTTLGAIRALRGTINSIFTPSVGWQSFASTSDAAIGAPVEVDALLRQRQAISASLPAIGSIEGLIAAIAATPNVVRYRGYENETPITNSIGIPGNSIAMVIDGGNQTDLAILIGMKKGQGVRTYGTLSVPLPTDPAGINRFISFSTPINVPVTYSLTVQSLSGFTNDIKAQIQSSIATWNNALGIGNGVPLSDAYMPARLFGGTGSTTFRVVPDSLLVARSGAAPSAADVPMAFNEAPYCISNYVSIRMA